MTQPTSARLDAILARLLELHPRKIDLSLARIERLLAALGHPERRQPPTVHVAGTNGKGSTIAFLRAFVESAGMTAHVYTSPHLVRFNERIRLAGRLVDDETLIAALEHCERVNEGETITFFEITTAAAFHLFAREPADFLMLETGLGGRVDATNVVAHPAATVITPVSIDHAEFLGDTVEKIAREKAGIFKRGAPAIIGFQAEAPRAVLEREAARAGAPRIVADRDFLVRAEHGRLIYEDEAGLLDLPAPRLAGRHQFENAATAIAALRRVAPRLPARACEAGMGAVAWPARLQHLTKGRLKDMAPRGADLWLDGGHNADGARVVAATMAEFEERVSAPLVLVCGLLATKDARGFLGAFRGLAREVVAVPVAGDHYGRAPADVEGVARALGFAATQAPDVEAALRLLAARHWPTPPRILVCGSLYLAGAALALDAELTPI